ncbi:ERI1 exoribonuclease 2 [Bulinus truncatus]|nr:ERI1 exoribonuclease 2 [Bulinus truncatus]
MAKSTKQLARELGLLRKRQLNESPARQIKKRQLINGQMFSYLIVLDFESTCWENDKFSPQEIIEFPAVLLNTKSGLIESEFHYYLHPTERPILSDFCKQLTGIKQDLVDNGIPLYNCLRKFTGWLNKLNKDKGITCADDKTTQGGDNVAAFVTWSDWDLGVCLHYEAKRKQIMKPSVFNRWIDLRVTYKNFYARKPDGLSGALKDLGILFEGREHSGLDDARNTAALAWRMICDGCVMAITKTVKMNSHVTNSNASLLRIKNTSFLIALDNVSTSAQFSPRHIHRDKLSEKNVVIFPLNNSCISEKKILSDSTNIQNSKTKSPDAKLAQTSLAESCKSEVNKIHQPSSKIPVIHGRGKNPHIPSLAEIVTKMPVSLPNKTTNSSHDQLSTCTKNISSVLTSTSSVNRESSPRRVSLHYQSTYSSKENISTSTRTTGGAATSTSFVNSESSPRRVSLHYQSTYSSKENISTSTRTTGGLATSTSPVNSESSPRRVSLHYQSTYSSKENISTSTRTTGGAATSTSFVNSESSQHNSHESSTPCRMHKLLKNLNPDQTTIVERSSSLSKFTPKSEKATLLNASNFKTPSDSGKINSVQSAFKTPRTISTNMKRTPPLCSCGRRSKRKLVHNQGPNHGRWFFSCSISTFNDRAKVGCKFFQWELPCVSLHSPSVT